MSKIYSGSATLKKKNHINGSWLCWFWDVKCCHGFSQLFLSFWSIFADILADWQQQKHAELLHCCLHFMDVQTAIFGLLWNWRKRKKCEDSQASSGVIKIIFFFHDFFILSGDNIYILGKHESHRIFTSVCEGVWFLMQTVSVGGRELTM